MPGGKITIEYSAPDLESFLARKRCPLDKWMLAHNITSLESFKALSSSGQWTISETLAKSVEELLKPVPVPAKAIAPIEVVPVVVEEPVQVAKVAAEESKQEVETQVVLNGEDIVVSSVEEVVPHVVEDSSIVSVNSYKERKKTR